MKYALLLFLLVLLLLTASVSLFSQNLFFRKVFSIEGKPFEHVTGIVQDKQGYMWFISKKGLYKFDGYTMSSYKNNPLNAGSVSGNLLESICIDSSGMIWIGTLGTGLDRLDPYTGSFTHFRHNSKDRFSLSNDTVASLLADHEGTLWAGTHGGLDRFDPLKDKFIHFRHNANDFTSISNNQVRSLYEDKNKTLWIGTGSPFPNDGGRPEGGGLNRLDKKSGKFMRYLHDPKNPNSIINNKVRAIFEDSHGVFWVGTGGNGLHTMNRKTGVFTRHLYDPKNPQKLSRPPIRNDAAYYGHITFITEDAAGAIWIGTSDAGVNYYDPRIQKIKYYSSAPDTTTGFIGNAWSAYTSRDGVLWVSTIQGNLYSINPLQKNLPYYKSTFGQVTSFYQQPNGMLWLGSAQGLILTDTNKKIIHRYAHDPLKSSSLSNNFVMSLMAEEPEKLWVGTQGGLNLFDTKREIFTRYLRELNKPRSISNEAIVPLYTDKQHNFWIGTLRGLNFMDRKKNLFKQYFIKQSDTTNFVLGVNTISSILRDRQGKLWVGAWAGSGLNQFNGETGLFKNFLKGVNITSILEDSDGELWAGSEDGLYQFNHSSQLFTRFTDPSSLVGIPDVISMAEDDNKNLWLGTTIGIIRLSRSRNETAFYGASFGIKENTLVYTAAYKSQKGELFFGDTTGYYAFFPGDVTKYSRPPEIVVSAFRIANKPVQAGANAPFQGLLWKTQQIKLHHNQNVFSLEFAVISYNDPQNNRNLFMLENYDDEWRIGEKSGRAYYFNVPPGKYIFKIKSSNSDGVWAQKEILIIITAPWWRTWWAYLIFAVFVTGIISGIFYYRSRSLLREKHILEEKVKSRTAEIVKQKEEIALQLNNLQKALEELKSTQAQLIQREKMASLGELTAGIAHEIQNPLNFVNNFSEVNAELIEEMKIELRSGNNKEAIVIADNISDNEQKINHHGKRAEVIVKGMLQHSRSSSFTKEPTDINALADEYFRLAYHGLRAKDKSFNATIKTDFDETIGTVNIIPQDIGRVILNLSINAFHAVTERKKNTRYPQKEINYEPTVTVSTKALQSSAAGFVVIISVKDNGNGIAPKILDKIFQPFYTTKPAGQGTGLGLSLSYDIIKAHGGELKVETKEGEGAEFILHLPHERTQ